MIEPLSTLFKVEGASGIELPYIGYIEVEVAFPFNAVGDQPPQLVLLLVTNDTNYNKTVPACIGTNILESCKDYCESHYGVNFIQRLRTPAVWKRAYQCMSHKVDKKIDGCLGSVKSTSAVTIPADQSANIHGITHLDFNETVTALADEGDFSTLPTGLLLEPACYELKGQGHSIKRIDLKVQNCTTKAITIPPKSVICQLHNVTIVPPTVSTNNNMANEEFMKLFDLSNLGTLEAAQQSKLKELLLKWKRIFSQHDLDLGYTTVVEHSIELTDETPFKLPHHRIPPSMYETVRQHVKDMLAAGVIRESKSPFTSPVVLAKKKDNSLRFCIDYRRLNARTVKDSFALPRLEETFDALVGARWFTCLDLKAGYWQVGVKEEDKHKTAFTLGPLGFYECERLPFGTTNAPATFQRLMGAVMGDLNLTQCLLYIDDIIVYSKTVEEHLERLEAVFRKLDEAGLKLKPSKCVFMCQEVKYLGHIVSSEGVKTDPDKIEALNKWPVPKNQKDVRKFLGFAGFYRRFIPHFSRIAKPLHDLLKDEHSPCTGHGKKTKGNNKNRRDKPKFYWETEQEDAFREVISKLTTTPVLAFADYSLPFIVHTDASLKGLGAVLYQEQQGQKRVIAYASRSLRNSEKNYPAHKAEFLALKWALSDKFRDYLYGHEFTVYTDNNPLTYILTTAKLDATGHRWLAELAQFNNFAIKYRAGRHNIDADSLSRIHDSSERPPNLTLSPDTVTSVISQSRTISVVKTVGIGAEAVPEILDASSNTSHTIDVKAAQKKEKDFHPLYKFLKFNHLPAKDILSRDAQLLLRERDHFTLVNDIIQRTQEVDGQTIYRVVLPRSLRHLAFHQLHSNAGHMGRDRTLSLMRERFYWPHMTRDVEKYGYRHVVGVYDVKYPQHNGLL